MLHSFTARLRYLVPNHQEMLIEARRWLREQGPWWATSVMAHLVVLASLLLIFSLVTGPITHDNLPQIDELEPAKVESAPPVDLTITSPEVLPIDVEHIVSPQGDENGALDTVSVPKGEPEGQTSPFPTMNSSSSSSISALLGTGQGDFVPHGAAPDSFGPRPHNGGGNAFITRGIHDAVGSGSTKIGERSVAAALQWLSRHQAADGSWSLGHFQKRCKDGLCSGPGSVDSDSAATALALLPFLAAGYTHDSKGPYQQTIQRGVQWLVSKQKPGGDLSAGSPQMMYSHALATIALCEAYGMTGDSRLRGPAEAAVRFIESAQNKGTGGWRYQPNEAGDTSVLGWQVMALKSAQMAGLHVDEAVLQRTHTWLKSVASGEYGGSFAYEPGKGATSSMTAVGLLCTQYLGARRADPIVTEGVDYLMHHAPDNAQRDLYYWYYASQAMHNMNDQQWDQWNRKIRKVLVESQVKEGCAAGSWDPELPSHDPWGSSGGRVMMTSLAALTLEVPYRFLALYKVDDIAGK